MMYADVDVFGIIAAASNIRTGDNPDYMVDDFLAVGKAMRGLLDICSQAGAEVAGIGIAIEKGFQSGGQELREKGYRVTSLAIIDEMREDGELRFRAQS